MIATIKEAVFEVLDREPKLRRSTALQEVWSKVMDTFPAVNIISVDRYIRLYNSKKGLLRFL